MTDVQPDRSDFKLVYEPTRNGVRWSLHDVEWDPLNRMNLAAQREDLRRDYAARLRHWLRRDPLRRMDAQGQLRRSYTELE